MALYSLNHSAIGKTTQARPHTASAHMKYITRRQACTHLLAGNMPDGGVAARKWVRAQEDADRKNARVIDKVMLALPRELTPAQNHALVREFAETLTEGRASWLAAFHDAGDDADNPHCHLVLRDRDPRTGKRGMQTTEKGSTQRMRILWEVVQNRHLQLHGHEARVDHRTLEAQGLDLEPQQHVGPAALALAERGARPVSRSRERRNLKVSRYKSRLCETRITPYERIDRGRTRQEHRQRIAERRRGLGRDRTLDNRRNAPMGRGFSDSTLQTEPAASIHDALRLEVSTMTNDDIDAKLLQEWQGAYVFDRRLASEQALIEDEIAKLASRMFKQPEAFVASVLSADARQIAEQLEDRPADFGPMRQNAVLAKLTRPDTQQYHRLARLLGLKVRHRETKISMRRDLGAAAEAAIAGRKPDTPEERRRELLTFAAAHNEIVEQAYVDTGEAAFAEQERVLEASPKLKAALDREQEAWASGQVPQDVKESYRLTKTVMAGETKALERALEARQRLAQRRSRKIKQRR